MFPKQQIIILEWFPKDHVTLKSEDWSNDAKNSALPSQKINYILKYS